MTASKIKSFFNSASGDSFFLIFVRVVTLVLGLITTRILSGHFSVYDYGGYSQIILLTTTISSMTNLGLMDAINFFFCRESDENKKTRYISTIFFIQYFVIAIVSVATLFCTVPISEYFKNESLKSLIIFAAVLPVLHNSISLLQVMFIAIGKAKLIAFKNLAVSILKLLAITLSCYAFNNIVAVLVFQFFTDLALVIYFVICLRKNNCKFNFLKFDKSLIKEILYYCIPMAMFVVIKSLNRDSDKFVISFFTNTQTLAVYTNASKLLPFDIVMTSFCTILLPFFTRFIAQKKHKDAQTLYKSFLEMSYTVTTIFAVGAICVAPELMRFLYTEKYVVYSYSVPVFIIYILVDIFSVLNATMILSAAGKTKTILFASIGTFFANIILNIGFYYAFAEIGPALATLLVTILQGIILLSLSAKEVNSSVFKIFDWKYLLYFCVQISIMVVGCYYLRSIMVKSGLDFIIILFLIYALFCGVLFLINFRRIIKNLRTINQNKSID